MADGDAGVVQQADREQPSTLLGPEAHATGDLLREVRDPRGMTGSLLLGDVERAAEMREDFEPPYRAEDDAPTDREVAGDGCKGD